ncbi:MAG: UDP-N-acetylglucosamine 2-epimerase (hydrolyzing) [Candidatus Scalindua sp.]|jgi:GDP/UDP-N,N'-diacetylbacillosamine 2-epimerase (hydrolysing)|nr:UDP-N-acetylglucosamine 2-epimerase (hydrolyzing) [Candidatus Scalindua sp.]
MRKVCVVTGTRAEYGLFLPILKKIKSSKMLELQLVVSTMHLSEEFGSTYKQIEEDGFRIDDKIENLLSADTKTAVAKSTGLAAILLSDSFNRLRPDVVLLLGDRYETHAAATTAMLMNIPIAHIHGGEVTEGAVDEQIRHSISKMSCLHFVATETYRKRLIQMGEASSCVIHSGAPGIDNIVELSILSKDVLERDLLWRFTKQSALFTYHPETLGDRNVADDIDEILETLLRTKLNVLFTYANADDSGRVINQRVESFCQYHGKRFKVVKSLGQLRYLSCMKHVDVLIGNTSSGIIEAVSFNKPVVNIGDRQKGRLQSGNVVNSSILSLAESIEHACSSSFKQKCSSLTNIYGNGQSADVIVRELEVQALSLIKVFVDASG